LAGSTLYGTTSQGGSSDNGVVFKVNTDGSGYAVLKSFTGGDGRDPEADLVLAGSTLYGTTVDGGSSGNGVVFKINTDGSDYEVLKSFTGLDGELPWAGLALSGMNLYGVTQYGGIYQHGGSNDWGTVFKINTDGSGFSVLKDFASGDGANPWADLMLSGTTLYGTTRFGGDFGQGVVFTVSLDPPTILTLPQTQTAEAGATVHLTVDAAGYPPLFYQWYLNGTNLLSCTSSNLVLTNMLFSEPGTYTVVISNVFGAVTSAPVMLNVIPPVDRRLVPGVNLMAQAEDFLGLDYSDNLGPTANWETMATMTLSNSSQYYFDLSEPLPPQRFYRAWQTGTPSVVPSLSLPGLVPAITLTGNMGDSLRLDYINQFGPIDAWVTLATVTLTNTSQLYFDTSSIGQPARLWRIVPAP
jgi:uncharacterized repeat protein (TIGR03803 family)